MPRLSVFLFVAAVALLVAAFAACDGDGGLTLEEYFQQLETLDQDAEAGIEALGFPEEFASEEERVLAIQDFFAASVPIIANFVDAIDDLDPPTEAEDAHNEAVDAGRDFVIEAEDLTNELADVESSSELEEVFDAPEYDAASDRFDQACFDLQDIADANSIDVDLTCEDEE